MAVLLLALSSCISLSVPFGFGRIIDVILGKKTKKKDSEDGYEEEEETITERLIPITALLGTIFVIGGAANAGRIILIQRTSQRIIARLRKDLFRSVMRMRIAFFDQHATGELVNRLSSDTVVVGKALSDNISDGLRSAAQGVAAGGMMFYMSPSLCLTVFTTVPPIAIMAVFYSRFMKRISNETQDALAAATSVAEERISNIRSVRAFAMEEALNSSTLTLTLTLILT